MDSDDLKKAVAEEAFDLNELLRERNEMLLSLDSSRFRAYMNKHSPGEADWDIMEDRQILHSMHLARLQVTTFSESIKAESRAWLKARGLRTFEDGPPSHV